MHAQTQYTHECSCTHMHMYKGTHTHTYIHTYIHTLTHTCTQHAPRAHHKYINLQLTHALAYNTYTHRQTDRHTHTHTHTHICVFSLLSPHHCPSHIHSVFHPPLEVSLDIQGAVREGAITRMEQRPKSWTWAFVPFILNFTPSF